MGATVVTGTVTVVVVITVVDVVVEVAIEVDVVDVAIGVDVVVITGTSVEFTEPVPEVPVESVVVPHATNNQTTPAGTQVLDTLNLLDGPTQVDLGGLPSARGSGPEARRPGH